MISELNRTIRAREKNKWISLLLCIFTVFGHKLYEGKIEMAIIYLLTGGGPFSLDYYQAGKTDLLVTWLYKLTVNRNDYSLASTIGIFIFILVSTCSLIVYNRTGAVQKEDQFQ